MNTQSKNLKRALQIYTVTVTVATLIGILLRCLNLAFFFDSDIGYYTSGAALPVIETVLLAAASLFCLVASVCLFRRASVCYREPVGKPMRAIAILAAVLSILFAVFRVINSDNTALLPRLLLLLSVIVAAYFLLQGGTVNIPDLPLFVTGLSVILWLLFALATSYFDITVQMNAPDKLLFQLGCLGGMIFTVGELRMLMGKPRPALYLFSTGIATLFLGVASLPTVIAVFADMMEKPSWFECNYILVGLFAYALARLITLTVVREPSPTASEETKEPVPGEDV